MMNMMTGAVAINGGVGVMEICQPKMVDQIVENAAQAVDQTALNVHITLHELKERVELVLEKKNPRLQAAYGNASGCSRKGNGEWRSRYCL